MADRARGPRRRRRPLALAALLAVALAGCAHRPATRDPLALVYDMDLDGAIRHQTLALAATLHDMLGAPFQVARVELARESIWITPGEPDRVLEQLEGVIAGAVGRGYTTTRTQGKNLVISISAAQRARRRQALAEQTEAVVRQRLRSLAPEARVSSRGGRLRVRLSAVGEGAAARRALSRRGQIGLHLHDPDPRVAKRIARRLLPRPGLRLTAVDPSKQAEPERQSPLTLVAESCAPLRRLLAALPRGLGPPFPRRLLAGPSLDPEGGWSLCAAYLLYRQPLVSRELVRPRGLDYDRSAAAYQLLLALEPAGARQMKEAAERYAGRWATLVLDGRVVASWVIAPPGSDGLLRLPLNAVGEEEQQKQTGERLMRWLKTPSLPVDLTPRR